MALLDVKELSVHFGDKKRHLKQWIALAIKSHKAKCLAL